MAAPAYEVVVIAGGASHRFGADKLALLLDRTLSGLPAAAPVVCVGPVRQTPSRTGVTWVREEPAGTGPLAAVAAALRRPAGEPVVVLAGGDMPSVGSAVPALVAALTAAGSGTDAVLLTDGQGRRQVLASAWHRAALAAAVDAVGDPDGVPLQRLLDGPRVALLPDLWGAARDVDTPADLPEGETFG
jgi:molybdopterin-guanine dinucleotide biosynthesis protein A